MVHPKERLAIYNRLRKISRTLEVFRITDCFMHQFGCYLGLHHSSDWQEVVNSLVEKGKLFTDGQGNYSSKPINIS